MATTLFVWLGSGRARRRHVHSKGQYLDQAAQAGLPVPAGAILLDELWRVFLEKDLLALTDGRIIVPDPELMHNTLFHSVRLPRFDRLAAVRAAFDPGDTPLPPRLNVDMNDPGQVAAALAGLWTAAQRANSPRSDILVMDMVAAEHSGESISRYNAKMDEVYVAGESGPPLVLSRSSGRQTATMELPPYARRLGLLLKGMRRTFGKGDWRINWIDDGQVCYLVQVAAEG